MSFEEDLYILIGEKDGGGQDWTKGVLGKTLRKSHPPPAHRQEFTFRNRNKGRLTFTNANRFHKVFACLVLCLMHVHNETFS